MSVAGFTMNKNDIRCFLAVSLPDPLREKLGQLIEALSQEVAGVKWVPAKNIHLTLRFFGSVSEEIVENGLVPRIEEVASRYGAMKLRVGRLGVFPQGSRPRVLWVGCDGDIDPLRGFVGDLEKGILGLPLHQEEKEFHAHLTLGRVKNPKLGQPLEKVVDKSSFFLEEELPISSVRLYKSQLSPKGAEYSVIREFFLRS
ncbi:MAG: 2'-5' RNA ligase [Deltaproteobacteria bacterium RIFCSPLOWO2_02_FULL_50_16]|nr:MAG: 2'-5' RNA ligase [Deltaproteobacteria bacterium RIFCSPLOWO2_02_FULL_50_16]